MKNTAEIIIIGGGLLGLSTAYWLTKKGRDVLIVERAPALAAGSGGATDGHMMHNTKIPGFHTTMGIKGSDMYREILPDLGETSGYVAGCGGYLLCDDEREYELVKKFTEQVQRESDLEIHMLDGDELRRLEPNLSPTLYGASYTPGGSKIESLGLVFGYARKVRERGGRILMNTPVTQVITQGGKALGVRTPKGEFYADAIVDACGSWSALTGILAGLFVPVKPRKGQVIVTEGIAPMLRGCVTSAGLFCATRRPDLMNTFRPMTTKLGHGCSMEQTESGAVLIGATNEWADFYRPNTLEAVEWLVAEAGRVMPPLRDVHFIRTFTGFRPFTPDHFPLVGPTRHLEGYYFAAGVEGGGLSIAPAASRMLAEHLCGEEPFLSMEPLNPDRLVKPLEEATPEELKKHLPAIPAELQAAVPQMVGA